MQLDEFDVAPIHGRVIVRVDITAEVVTESGLVVELDSDRQAKRRIGRDRTGVVVAVDVDHPKSPPVNVGDRVFWQVSWQGEPWERDGVRYHTLEPEDCAAVIAPDVMLESLEQ